MGKDNDRGFKVITAFIKPGFRLRFSPTIIGAENIPKDGAVVIAGNHKNISDQFLVFLATKRVVNYMAKREYFDGALAPLFRWAGCIPVNRDGFDAAAVRSAIKILKKGGAVIVPFAITGEYERKGGLKIVFGKAFSPADMSPEAATEKLYNEVRDLLTAR